MHPQGELIFNFGVPPTGYVTAAVMPAPFHSFAPMDGISGNESYMELGKASVVGNAVHSLYADQVKPYGRILRKRIAEQALELTTALGLSEMDIDPFALRQTCERCNWLSVIEEDAGEWVCLINGKDMCFVDATDPNDSYAEDVWVEFAKYLDSISHLGSKDPQVKFPGGRYACAKELQGRHLPFLEARTLGEICHIVQLAITQKLLLGYTDGCLVPFKLSQTRKKRDSATVQQPLQSRNNRPSATMDEVVEFMQDVMDKAWIQSPASRSQKGPTIPLSNVKRMFRSQYKKRVE